MKNRMKTLAAAAALALAALPAFAHHGYAAYDETVTKTLTGKVTDFELMNPHSLMSWDVKGANGKPESWTGEAGHVRLMKSLGWAADTLKEGDTATFYYHPAKDGAHSVDIIQVKLPNGKTLFCHSSGAGAAVQ